MNQPLTHRQYTFYQQSFERQRDPHTGRQTGDFSSVLSIGHDAGRPLMYGGAILIVLGAFLQFYMRAGIFTDGGKRETQRETERAADKARKLLAQKGKPAAAATPAPGKPAKAGSAKAPKPKNYDDAIL
jgi:hypothetical protein